MRLTPARPQSRTAAALEYWAKLAGRELADVLELGPEAVDDWLVFRAHGTAPGADWLASARVLSPLGACLGALTPEWPMLEKYAGVCDLTGCDLVAVETGNASLLRWLFAQARAREFACSDNLLVHATAHEPAPYAAVRECLAAGWPITVRVFEAAAAFGTPELLALLCEHVPETQSSEELPKASFGGAFAAAVGAGNLATARWLLARDPANSVDSQRAADALLRICQYFPPAASRFWKKCKRAAMAPTAGPGRQRAFAKALRHTLFGTPIELAVYNDDLPMLRLLLADPLLCMPEVAAVAAARFSRPVLVDFLQAEHGVVATDVEIVMEPPASPRRFSAGEFVVVNELVPASGCSSNTCAERVSGLVQASLPADTLALPASLAAVESAAAAAAAASSAASPTDSSGSAHGSSRGRSRLPYPLPAQTLPAQTLPAQMSPAQTPLQGRSRSAPRAPQPTLNAGVAGVCSLQTFADFEKWVANHGVLAGRLDFLAQRALARIAREVVRAGDARALCFMLDAGAELDNSLAVTAASAGQRRVCRLVVDRCRPPEAYGRGMLEHLDAAEQSRDPGEQKAENIFLPLAKAGRLAILRTLAAALTSPVYETLLADPRLHAAAFRASAYHVAASLASRRSPPTVGELAVVFPRAQWCSSELWMWPRAGALLAGLDRPPFCGRLRVSYAEAINDDNATLLARLRGVVPDLESELIARADDIEKTSAVGRLLEAWQQRH